MNKSIGLLIIAVITIVGVSVFVFRPSPAPSTVAVQEKKRVMYKNGIYTQAGMYTSPAGPEEIDVKLTIKNSIIVKTQLTPKATNLISKSKQTGFAKEYASYVVGKNINDLRLGKIAGASLTPKGFNDAVEKIKAQAKS